MSNNDDDMLDDEAPSMKYQGNYITQILEVLFPSETDEIVMFQLVLLGCSRADYKV